MIIGYGDRFTGGFFDAEGAKVNIIIKQKDYTGSTETLTLSDDPLVINRPTGDLNTYIFGTGCKINIINTGDFLKYSELFGTPERQHYVIITRDYEVGLEKRKDVLFEGFVLPQLYSQDLRKNSQISIPANDQLSSLKNKKYDVLKDVTTNYIKLIDLIVPILYDTGLNIFVMIKNGIWNPKIIVDGYDINYVTPFEYTYVDKSLFLNSDGDPKDSYYVLETILKTFGCRLYYDGTPLEGQTHVTEGWWVIERVKNLDNFYEDLGGGVFRNKYKAFIYIGEGTPINGAGFVSRFKREIELSGQTLINDGSLEYESGVKTYEVVLNTELLDNLVKPSFKDIKSGGTFEYYYVGTSGVDDVVGAMTYPYRYEWVHNIDDSLGDPILSIKNSNFNDANIINGIHWDCDRGNVNQVFPAFAALTTRITLDYNNTIPKENYSLSLKFKYSMLGLETFNNSNRNYRSRFTLRYKNYNGDFKTIYIDANGKAQIHNTGVSNLDRLYIDNLTTTEDIKNSSDPSAFIVNQDIFLGDIIDNIKTDIAQPDINPTYDVKFLEFYLDFYLLQEHADDNWAPIQTKFGDLEVSTSIEIQENVIEGTTEDNYNTRLDLNLDLYDSKMCNIKNTLYFKVYNSFIPSGWFKWMEYGYTYRRHLQYMFLTDLIQNYNQNRYLLNVSVRPTTVYNFSFSDLFSYTHITKNSTPVKMILMGYDYNVKSFTYNLHLQEWKDDDGFFYNEFYGEGPVSLSCTPTIFQVPSWGGIKNVSIKSDTDWTVSTIYDWIILNTTEGFGNDTVYFSVLEIDNPNFWRTGTVTIKTLDETITVNLTINQIYTNNELYYVEVINK